MSSSQTFDIQEVSQPLDFIHVRTSPAYLRGAFGHRGRTMLEGDTAGVRYSWGPFSVEYYTGDKEPMLSFFRGFRLVIWDRVRLHEKPEGWASLLCVGPLAPHAIVNLQSEKYWENWSHGTKSHRSKWFTQDSYEITAVTLEEFIPHFKKYARPAYTVSPCIKMMRRQVGEYGDDMHFFILRHKQTSVISAGICVAYYPAVNQAYYISSFYAREHIPRQAGVWLLNYWFMRCKERGVPYANLGTVYAQGQSKSWKGFTEFKMYFHPFIVRCQAPLIRFTASLKKVPLPNV